MDVFRVVAIGIIGAILALTLRQSRPEYALIVSLATGALLLMALLGDLRQAIESVKSLAGRFSVQSEAVTVALKTVGIACVADLGAQMSKDAGESAIASKIELGAKLLIVTLALPVLVAVLDAVFALLP